MTPAPTLEELIALARDEAPEGTPLGRLGHAARMSGDITQTADDLVGHYVDECRQAGHTWAEISEALGVTRQAVHKRFAAGPPDLSRFTERARLVMAAATNEALARERSFVGTEHLLLALFGPPEAIAAKALAAAGLTKEQCSATLDALEPSDPGPAGGGLRPDGRLPWSPKAALAVRRALDEALSLGHNYIGTEHLLLGLFKVPDTVATRLLADMGASEADLRQRMLELLAAHTESLDQLSLPPTDEKSTGS
jgi:hypothetical protein